MLRRLLLALLLLALSAPAMAMGGHCAPSADATALHHAGSGHGHHQPAPAQAERGDCIGCVLPLLGILPAPKAQAPTMVIGASSQRPPLALVRQGPTPPPPRS